MDEKLIPIEFDLITEINISLGFSYKQITKDFVTKGSRIFENEKNKLMSCGTYITNSSCCNLKCSKQFIGCRFNCDDPVIEIFKIDKSIEQYNTLLLYYKNILVICYPYETYLRSIFGKTCISFEKIIFYNLKNTIDIIINKLWFIDEITNFHSGPKDISKLLCYVFFNLQIMV